MATVDYCGICGPTHRTRPGTNRCMRHDKPIKGLPETPDPSKAVVEVESREDSWEQYLPCNCYIEYVPDDKGTGAKVTVNWCTLHEGAQETAGKLEEAEEKIAEVEDKLVEATADREEMLDRLGMTEHEWVMRRTWFGAPQTTLALPAAPKRRARKGR